MERRDAGVAGGHSPRWPGLAWAILHVPVILFLYAGPIAQALRGVPEGFQRPLYPAFVVQALTLTVLLWLVALPLSFSRRLFRWTFPVLTALATLVMAIDARTYAAVGFHINGFFLRVAIQPSALRETGIPTSDVAWFLAEGLVWLVAEVVVGTWFLRRFTSPRPVWKVAVALLLLAAGERFYSASVAFFGGPGVFAAGQALPLQAPVRMGNIWERLTGRKVLGSPLKGVSGESAVKLPPGIDPAEVKFTRTPDVVFVLLESARADYLDPQVMPLLSARAATGGTVFERHYALAPTTYFTVFGLLFGLEAHKLDAVVGAGRKPLLFRAFTANGYQSKFLAASSVDWMGLRDQVFGDVKQSLETDWPHDLNPEQTDAAMVAEGRRFVEAASDKPVFLFLFFVGTHFNYTYPPRAAKFSPVWNGEGILKAAEAPGHLILNRARNSAFEADLKVDEFLTWFELKRGRRPLVIVTGDHGEEMREQGHVGHGSALTVQQLQVPMVVLGDGVPVGRRDTPTSHADVVPTLMALLGDTHPPESYAAGESMFTASPDRFVLTTVGWEPKFAAIGKDLKVSFSGIDAGFGGVTITDPFDRPLPDGEARFSREAPRILKLFGK
jgi:membrane-anchored protein YejM (alkaline phosphatase superfamily)